MTGCYRIEGQTLLALALLLSPLPSFAESDASSGLNSLHDESSEAGANPSDRERDALMDLERRSHHWWLDGDAEALGKLMKDDYRFVAPNGAVETKAYVTGVDPDSVRMLQVESMTVSPQEVVLGDNRAIVISVIEMDATVAGRPAPGRLRVLSVFEREDADSAWRLAARSTTPVRTPPRKEPE